MSTTRTLEPAPAVVVGESPPVVLREKRPLKGFNIALFVARLWFWAWTIITKFLTTLAYWYVMTKALRMVLPELGTRLSKLPGLDFMREYTALYRLDLAHLFSTIPLISTWVLWHLSLELYLRPELFAERFRGWDVDTVKRTLITMAAIVLTGDALLFGTAFMFSGWGTAKSPVAATIATLVYITLLGFATFVAIYLSDRIEQLKKEDRS